ncbi:hypothetical protein [Pengzhenrongella phosphoraccumulans]|uniref:hypothetical protein n=1 Tax=Pengzhenrongella phosphoraccumulans TaxID=3114394 RepID=UPI00388F8FA3
MTPAPITDPAHPRLRLLDDVVARGRGLGPAGRAVAVSVDLAAALAAGSGPGDNLYRS